MSKKLHERLVFIANVYLKIYLIRKIGVIYGEKTALFHEKGKYSF